jgi:3-phenylpropionate/trans-cinnamate dioxygenase ferredoxin component
MIHSCRLEDRRLSGAMLESTPRGNTREKYMGDFVKAVSASEIAPGQARLVNIKGKEIALFNIDGTFFALENACTHEEGPLAEGEIEGHEVTCPWHGARFDVRTGEVLCAPAYEDAARYNVRVTGSDIEVEI